MNLLEALSFDRDIRRAGEEFWWTPFQKDGITWLRYGDKEEPMSVDYMRALDWEVKPTQPIYARISNTQLIEAIAARCRVTYAKKVYAPNEDSIFMETVLENLNPILKDLGLFNEKN